MEITPETDEERLENVKGESPVNVESNEEDSPVVSDLVMDHQDPESDYGGAEGPVECWLKNMEEVGIYADQLESGRSILVWLLRFGLESSYIFNFILWGVMLW